MNAPVDLDIDLTWGGTETYEVVYADGTAETVDMNGREASQLATAPNVNSVSRVTGFGANARSL